MRMACNDDAPYLPHNRPGASHHLAADKVDRVLDTHFRLLRQDVLRTFWADLQETRLQRALVQGTAAGMETST